MQCAGEFAQLLDDDAKFCKFRDDGVMRLADDRLRSLRLDALSHHDDAEEDQLEEGLRDPRHDDDGVVRSEGARERDERKRSEGVCGPHRADEVRDALPEPAIEAPHVPPLIGTRVGDTHPLSPWSG